MIRIFASDLDDTLLNAHKQISPTNIAAIQRLQQSGVEFVMASGRHYPSMREIARSAGIHCAHICLGGAEYWDSDGVCRERALFPAGLAEEGLRFVEQIGGACICYCAEGNFFYPSAEKYRQELYLSLRDLVKIPQEQLPSLVEKIMTGEGAVTEGDISRILSHGMIKLDCVFGDADTLFAADKHFSQYSELCRVMPQQSRLEMTCVGSSKAEMLQRVAASKGFSLKEAAAIGDSDNDLTMLSAVEHSFAVANAEEHVKSICRYVVADYEDDGVAKAIDIILELNAADS